MRLCTVYFVTLLTWVCLILPGSYTNALAISNTRINTRHDANLAIQGNAMISERSSRRQHEKRQPAVGSSSFEETSQPHSPAFNIVHVIAAVAGAVCLLLVAIVSFVLFRRRQRQRQLEKRANRSSGSSTSTAASACTSSPPTATHQHQQHKASPSYDQFAHDFAYEGGQAPQNATQSATMASIPSPSMQQYQLQSHLQQLRQQQHNSQPTTPTHTRTAAHHHDTDHVPPSTPPPPPYQP
ncbi:hypothetical protein BC940DRAFT_300011 [Gongronella butleri]|nr:hypothetical protein BC940DRAFT_300011 [Gongronella butleri]